jgi:hypothetical protein
LLACSCGRAGFGELPADGSHGDGLIDAPTCKVTGYTTNQLPGPGAPRAAVTADFNGDGHLDVAVTSGNNAGQFDFIGVYLGNGDGTMGARTDYAAGLHSWSIAAGDLNGDGKPDLVGGFLGANQVGVYLNRGDGTFATVMTYATGLAPQSVVIADFDRDGHADVALTAHDSNEVQVLRGDGTGALGAPASLPTGTTPYQVVTADLDGDGTPDLVACDQAAAAASVMLGTGGGAFASHVDYAASSGGGPYSLALGDVDGDGLLDIALANNYSNGKLDILLGQTGGTFGAPGSIVLGAMLEQLWWVEIGDFTGDGANDIAIADATTGAVIIVAGDGHGAFQPARSYSVGLNPLGLAAGDFDRNGGLDIVVAEQGTNQVALLLAQCQ